MLINNLFDQLRETEVLISQTDINDENRVILAKCKLIEAQECIEAIIKTDIYMHNIEGCKHKLSPKTDSSWFDVHIINSNYNIADEFIDYHPILFSIQEDYTTKPERLFFDIIIALCKDLTADR